MTPAELAEVFEAAASKAREIEARQRQARADWVDQAASPLGRKRHCAAARRLVAAGSPGAAVVGRRHLLSSDALAAELGSLSAKKSKSVKAPTVADELRAELRLVGGR